MRTIKFKTKYEDLITRIPGLFAYEEMDEYGNSILHKATDSPMGCYGKIVENVKVNCSVGEIIKNGETYPFKYLLNLYYKHKNEKEYEGLVSFIEKGIGKIKVELNDVDLKECDLVPSVIYLSNIYSLYEEMVYLKRVSELYEKYLETKDKDVDNENENRLCCKHKEYIRKGGLKMLEFLEEKLNSANDIAEEYYGYAIGRDDSLTIDYNINLFSSERDLGVVTPINNKIVLNNTKSFNKENYTFKPNVYYDEDGDKIPNKEIKEINFSYKTESKLNSLRRYKSYVDVYGNVQTPSDNKDWLFYYRIGQIRNLSILNYKNGNIALIDYDDETEKDYEYYKGKKVKELVAYGDVIDKISINEVNKQITFTYRTDVHLCATIKSIEVDEDNIKKVFYDNFEADDDNFEIEDGNDGIKYEEIYYYDENSEIVDLINDGKFDNYIKGEYDEKLSESLNNGTLLKYCKFEFNLSNNITQVMKNFNGENIINNVLISPNVSLKINREVDNEDDEICDIIRNDFYEGISYSPTEEIDVNIDRGIVSIFEKHIRFGEIKTFEDLDESSFFQIQSMD